MSFLARWSSAWTQPRARSSHGGFDAVATPPAEGVPALAVGEVAVFVAVWAEDWDRYELVEGRFGSLRVADDPTRATEIARIAGLAAPPTP